MTRTELARMWRPSDVLDEVGTEETVCSVGVGTTVDPMARHQAVVDHADQVSVHLSCDVGAVLVVQQTCRLDEPRVEPVPCVDPPPGRRPFDPADDRQEVVERPRDGESRRDDAGQDQGRGRRSTQAVNAQAAPLNTMTLRRARATRCGGRTRSRDLLRTGEEGAARERSSSSRNDRRASSARSRWTSPSACSLKRASR